ncbi:MAG: ABC transporter ATP-binding protein [Ardenticatenales bacterium]|nr:ABC transporter ATP-binding protein [Ardenticatenales bacterium]
MLERIAGLSDERAHDTRTVARRLLAYLQPETTLLLGVAAMLILTAMGQGGAPALIGIAVDRYITGRDPVGLQQTMFLLLGAYLIGLVGFMGQAWLMGLVSQRVLLRLRNEIFEHLQRLSLRFYDRQEAGDLMSRLVSDTEVIGNLLSQALIQSLGGIFTLIGIAIGMFLLNWQLALASLLIIPIMFATTQAFSARARSAFRATRESIGDVSSNLQEDISSVREAQAFNRTAQNVERFQQVNAANRDANVRAGGVTAAFGPAIDVLSTVATAIVAGVGGWLAFRDVITVGVVVTFLTYVDRFFRPVQQIAALYTSIQAAFAAGERIFELLDESPDIVDHPNALSLPPMAGHVRFDNVTFGYHTEHEILKGISFEAQPGETVAIVGPTGTGKTTLVNLIARLYDVTGGRVLLDGHDVRDVTRRSLRSQLGVVPQDAFLFAGTVADNLRYGNRAATMDELIAAAQAARAHEFILALPEGYDTPLGERGGTLSQGQRQLLAIARALLANPRLLILDEATASVDTRTERLIQSALEVLLEGRTAFVIAHRLSTIHSADQILVMQTGEIVERGTHEELLAKGMLYADLYQKQIRPAA